MEIGKCCCFFNVISKEAEVVRDFGFIDEHDGFLAHSDEVAKKRH